MFNVDIIRNIFDTYVGKDPLVMFLDSTTLGKKHNLIIVVIGSLYSVFSLALSFIILFM